MSISDSQFRSLLSTLHELVLFARKLAYEADDHRVAELLDDADHVLNILQDKSAVTDVREIVRLISEQHSVLGLLTRSDENMDDL